MNRIINGIEVYTISRTALKIYRTEAKVYQDMEEDMLERKMTAMILTAQALGDFKDMGDSYIYRFGSFSMTVNKKSKIIEVIYWQDLKHSHNGLGRDHRVKLRENHRLLGLKSSGLAYAELEQ